MTEDSLSVWERARRDIVDVPVMDRLSSVLVTGGVLMFGVGLGVKWAATKSLTRIGNTRGWQSELLPDLAQLFNGQMKLAIAAATALLVVGVLVETWGGDDE